MVAAGPVKGRPNPWTWLWLGTVLAAIAATGCGGSGGNKGYARWGGMSEEQWRKARQAKLKAEEGEEGSGPVSESQENAASPGKAVADQESSNSQGSETPPPPPPPASQEQAPPHTAADAKPEAPPPEELDLPEKYSEWTEKHFLAARRLGDERLRAAVAYLGQHAAGKEAAAKLLTSLVLLPPAESEHPPEANPPPADPALVEAVAAALGTNGTPTARQTLGRLITGRLKTGDQRGAAQAALKSLIEHPSVEHEEMLFRVLTAAEQLRPPGQDELSADELLRLALELLEQKATPQFRKRLAQHFVEAPRSCPVPEPLLRFLAAPVAANLDAQAMLYQSTRIDRTLRVGMQRHLAAFSAEVLGQAFGVTSPSVPSGEETNWPTHVAAQLWTASFARAIEGELDRATAIKEAASAVVLAASVPTDLTRAALYRALEEHWEDGAEALAEAGVPGESPRDPGLVVVLKLVRRRAAASTRPDAAKRLRSSRTDSKELLASQQAREDINKSWDRFLQDVVRALCGQWGSCELSTPEASGGPRPADIASAARDLPLTLHATASVRALGRVDWPATAPPGFVADPLRVHYVRIEEKARPAKLLGHYRRQLGSCEMRPLDHGVWLDKLSAGGGVGWRSSLDVLIRSANPESRRLPEEEQKVIVEILSIEIRDPARSGDAASPAGEPPTEKSSKSSETLIRRSSSSHGHADN